MSAFTPERLVQYLNKRDISTASTVREEGLAVLAWTERDDYVVRFLFRPDSQRFFKAVGWHAAENPETRERTEYRTLMSALNAMRLSAPVMA